MKKRMTILAGLATLLLATAGVGSAYAYFTTFADAQGGHVLSLGDRTEITERFADWTKKVKITSEEDSEPVYVRARAYGPSAYPLIYSGEGWRDGGDGWWYYCDEDIVTEIVLVPLLGGEETSELQVKITGVPESELLEDGDSLHVVVVYESTPVRYHEDGSPYAEWEDELLKEQGSEGGGN